MKKNCYEPPRATAYNMATEPLLTDSNKDVFIDVLDDKLDNGSINQQSRSYTDLWGSDDDL